MTALALALTLVATTACTRSDATPSAEAAATAPAERADAGARPHPGEISPESWPKNFRLAKETQLYLWDIEHLNFVLWQDVLPIFSKTIRERDPSGLKKLLAPEFEGKVFRGPGETHRHSLVSYAAWNPDDPKRRLDREAFAQAIVDLAADLETIEDVGFHVYYLTPDEYGNLDGRWTLRWEGRVGGAGPKGERIDRRFEMGFGLLRLTKEMGQDEGWIDSGEILRLRRVESPRALMEDVTDSTGIDVEALSDNWDQPEPPYNQVPGIARLLDFDRDGRVDLLMTDMLAPGKRLFLYRGLAGGKFEDVAETVGLGELVRLTGAVWITGGLVADLDNDGYEDLLFSVEQRTPKGRAHAVAIYRNVEGKSFEPVLESVHNLGRRYRLLPRGVAAADYDGDGLIDLYLGAVGREPPPELRQPRWIGDRSSREGVLVKNMGGFRFEDVTAAAGMTEAYTDTASANWLDLEPDGDPDLFVDNHMGVNVLWENLGDGTFRRRQQPPGFGGFGMGSTAGDLDGDGDPDVYVANMYTSSGARIIDNLRPEDYPPGAYELIRGFATGNEFYENRGGDGPMEPLGISAEVYNSGWAYGPELVDLDGDGLYDVYSPAGFQSVKRGEPDG